MPNYTLALFLKDSYQEYLLKPDQFSGMEKNLEEINAKNIHFNELFVEKNEVWHIRSTKNVSITFLGKDIQDKKIAHGDFYMIRDIKTDTQLDILITSLEKENLALSKYKLEKNNNIFIGRLPENDISFDINNSVSRKHAAIRFDEAGKVYIEDLSRKTGVFVNGQKVNSHELKFGDIVYIMGLKLVYFGDYLALSKVTNSTSLRPYTLFSFSQPKQVVEEEKTFVRSPRIVKTLEKGEFEIDQPPARQGDQDIPLIFTIGPSLTMGIAMLVSLFFLIGNARSGTSMISSLIMAVSMLIGAIVWPLAMNKYQKRKRNKEENYRVKRYSEYIFEQKAILDEKKHRNVTILSDIMFPKPDVVMSYVEDGEKKRRLWEKTIHDGDFLEVRLGTGEREFDVKIRTSKKGFVLHQDPLADEPEKLAEAYRVLKEVPITISLKEQKTIGLVGKKSRILNNMQCMALNLAGQHSYEEVKMVFVYNKLEQQAINWVKELPHVWSNDRSMRYTATNKEEVHQLFVGIDEVLKEREEQLREGTKSDVMPLPKFVFFIVDEDLVENEPLMRYITDPNNPVDVSSVFVYGDISKLPKDCSAIINNDRDRSGIYYKNKYNNRLIEFQPDQVSDNVLYQFAKKLSSMKVKTDSVSLNVPDKVSFLGMYKVGNIEDLHIEDRWKKSESHKSLAVPIGIKAGGELFDLNVHEKYHGPHGLVAGMTGSGKSEFLQAYIASAAVNFHPHDLAFVLIDYKGGGMANVFDGMPHIAGKITNLSGSELRRSLISIQAEIKQRQFLFNEYGVNNIDKYQQLYKLGKARKPLPHLVIISDEFAQLKSQQPDFMRQLIDIAQIGRSLGIHLVLATQKPAGVVDDQIWGNSRFRVCLKVLDKHDSNEMIRKQDAALIKEPGRCYVQVGYDEIYEYLQSGYSGTDYRPTEGFIDMDEQTIQYVNSTATPIQAETTKMSSVKTGKSELEGIIEFVTELASKINIEKVSLWLEPLKEMMGLKELKGYQEFTGSWQNDRRELSAVVGLADFPSKQEQWPVELNLLKDGHTIIYGASGTGKTTFLQTTMFSFASKYAPEELTMYIFDFGGRSMGYFANMPHCEGVVYADGEEKVEEIIEDLTEIMEERKLLFSNHHVGSYEAYRNSVKEKLPAIMVVIDNYSIFRERYFSLEDSLVKLVANAKTYGIYFVISGNSKNAVYYKVTEHVSNFLTFSMNDPLQYREILGMTVPVEPENVKGRGLTVIGEVVEFHTALVIDNEDEPTRVKYIQQKIEEMNSVGVKKVKPSTSSDRNSKKVPKNSPSEENKSSANSNVSVSGKPKSTLPLIEPGDQAVHVGLKRNKEQGLPFMDWNTYFIGGLEKTGKTDYFKFFIQNLTLLQKKEVVLIDRNNKELEEFGKKRSVNKYISSAEEFDRYVKELESEVKVRLKVYENMISSGQPEDVLYGYMQKFDKLFICINDFSSFFDMISDEALEIFEHITTKSKGLNIYFVTLGNVNKVIGYNSTELYMYLVKSEHGIIMGGNINKQMIFTFDDMGYEERMIKLKSGEGFLFKGNDYAIVKNPSHEMEVVG